MPVGHETWSAAQERTTVSVDGHDVEIAYRDSATGATGSSGGNGSDPREAGDESPVVFLHGIPTWGYLWRRVAPELEDRYRTVVPDLVGYGNSERSDGFDRSIRAQEQALVHLLDDLGLETVHLVAHDVGGGVALRVAAHEPERVDALVVSNAVCYDSWPVEFITDLGLPETAEMDDAAFEGTLDAAFAEGTYGEPDPAFVEGMKAPWLRDGGKRALSRAAVATNTNHTMEIDYDAVREALTRDRNASSSDDAIEADLLCLWAEADAMQPISYGERLAESVGGRVEPVSEAYHWVMEDRPTAYRTELRAFLTENDR